MSADLKTPGEKDAEAKKLALEIIIEQVSYVVHESMRAFAVTLGDAQPAWQDAPDRQPIVREFVGLILAGVVRTPADLYELRRDPGIMPPYADLPPKDQAKHRLFFTIVTAINAEAPRG